MRSTRGHQASAMLGCLCLALVAQAQTATDASETDPSAAAPPVKRTTLQPTSDSAAQGPAEEGSLPESGEPRPEPLVVHTGIRLYSRSFRYTESLAQLEVAGVEALESYNLDAGPMPLIHVQWYPAAHFTSGTLAQIGLSAGYEVGVSTRVRYLDESGEEERFGQNHQLAFGGLRAKLPLRWLTLGVLGHVGHHAFLLRPTSKGVSPEQVFPNVAYTFLEAGADLEVQVGHVFFGAHGAYLAVVDAGDIATEAWFPNASSYGVHYGATVGVALSPFIDIVAGVDARLMAFNFNPISADVDPEVTPVAGGAADHFLSASLALRFRLPGSDGRKERTEGEENAEGATEGSGDNGAVGFDHFDSFD